MKKTKQQLKDMKESKLRKVIREEILREVRRNRKEDYEHLKDVLQNKGLYVEFRDGSLLVGKSSPDYEIYDIEQVSGREDKWFVEIRPRKGRAVEGVGFAGLAQKIENIVS